MTFPLGALRLEQMPPTRVATQDFPGASHFKTLGYRLFRLTSRDRFWHKEPVKYALTRDSQAQNWALFAEEPKATKRQGDRATQGCGRSGLRPQW
jgi:hypothetical protein